MKTTTGGLLYLTFAVAVQSAVKNELFDYKWRFLRGDSPPPQRHAPGTYNCRSGALGAGEDLDSGIFTADDAEAHCDASPACVGFTYEGNKGSSEIAIELAEGSRAVQFPSPSPPAWDKNQVGSGGSYKVYFKSGGKINSDITWQSCIKLAPTEPAQCPPEIPFCQPSFDDSQWSSLNLPHDWSAQDLPSREEDTRAVVLGVRNGTWLFKTGDNASYSQQFLDESSWASVNVPHDWRDPPTSYTTPNSYAWYRRHITLTPNQAAAAKLGELTLALGTVGGWDEAFFDGKVIGTSGGSVDKLNCKDYLTYRKYALPVVNSSSSVNTHVIAVRVFSAGGEPGDGNGKPGGLVDTGSGDKREGPFDAGASHTHTCTQENHMGEYCYSSNMGYEYFIID